MTRRPRNLIAAVLMSVTSLCGTAAKANPGPIADILCSPADHMRDRLRTQFGSELSWQGLRNPEEVMELWEDSAGNWTLVIAKVTGTRCIVAMGTGVSGFADLPQG